MEYPQVIFDDRRFMNAITRSNGLTIIIGNHDYLISHVDMNDRENRLQNAYISHFIRHISTLDTPVLNGTRYLQELEQLVIANRNTWLQYNEGRQLIAHEQPHQLRATNQLNQTNEWHRR